MGKLGGPFIATKTNANIVEEINWKPAFEVYRELVEADSGASFDSQDFFDIAKDTPLGWYVKAQNVLFAIR